ncbi:FkbM family methyltransferase [Kibdelosporangium persicum]|uniref:Methyltransferase, FkbM family n=2 Tax=Kibdelosporangium persicum TaxID=2698649 RepID=A0ABX2F4W8_9PSEU|nr:Methyltransferase, FkbM family [Kibdelosporangium persicum]
MRAFADTMNGYFVDVGAADPVLANVVKNLSEHLGWTGVHIEPDPNFADRLKNAYPGDHVVQAVVGARAGRAEFFEVDDGWLSTMDPVRAAAYEDEGRTVNSRVVDVTTLDSVLHSVGARAPIDLLKIDVEGTEPDVLAGLSFETWKPRVVVVETTTTTPRPGAANCDDLLRAHGYTHTLFDGCNGFYVAPGEPREFVEALSVPANVFDRYAPVIWFLQLDEDQRPPVRLAPRRLT